MKKYQIVSNLPAKDWRADESLVADRDIRSLTSGATLFQISRRFFAKCARILNASRFTGLIPDRKTMLAFRISRVGFPGWMKHTGSTGSGTELI